MNLDEIIEEMLADEDKVRSVKTNWKIARAQIIDLKTEVRKAQMQLDAVNSKLQSQIKTFQQLDKINAEYEFALKKQLELKAKVKTSKPRQAKSSAQSMADVMACLEALPEDQRQAVLAAMQQKGEIKND